MEEWAQTVVHAQIKRELREQQEQQERGAGLQQTQQQAQLQHEEKVKQQALQPPGTGAGAQASTAPEAAAPAPPANEHLYTLPVDLNGEERELRVHSVDDIQELARNFAQEHGDESIYDFLVASIVTSHNSYKRHPDQREAELLQPITVLF